MWPAGIGTLFLAEESPENRVDAARSLLIGLALITLVFMIPVLGFAAWSVLCVLALGAAGDRSLCGVEARKSGRTVPGRAIAAAGTGTGR